MSLVVHGEALHKVLLKFDIPNFSQQPSDRFILKKIKICWQNATENSDIPNNERFCDQQSRLGKQKGQIDI